MSDKPKVVYEKGTRVGFYGRTGRMTPVPTDQEIIEGARKQGADLPHGPIRVVRLPRQTFQALQAIEALAEERKTQSAESLKKEAKELLRDWHAITDAIGLKHKDRGEVISLNKRFAGPIRNSGAGTKPFVLREDLIDWWNRLYVLQQELANHRRGAKLSAEAQHNYGRTGAVAPEIGGSIKRRRRRAPKKT